MQMRVREIEKVKVKWLKPGETMGKREREREREGKRLSRDTA